ncbi:MAG: hypothetical protein ACO23F_05760 [Candidatus Limnocylindrus sp.]
MGKYKNLEAVLRAAADSMGTIRADIVRHNTVDSDEDNEAAESVNNLVFYANAIVGMFDDALAKLKAIPAPKKAWKVAGHLPVPGDEILRMTVWAHTSAEAVQVFETFQGRSDFTCVTAKTEAHQ